MTRAFTDSGIMVHAYLMYGFPTETAQETIDSLERVRQLFAEGCIQSAFWHRFAATAHSPIGQAPERYGIELVETVPSTFARNDLAFVDPAGCDHDFFAEGLRTALYNYMHGMGLDLDPRAWFAGRRGAKVPRTTVDPELVRRALGAGILGSAPWLMRLLSVAGTAAMFLVGGGILAHGIPAVHHWTEGLVRGDGLAGHLGPALTTAAVGVAAGGVLVGLATLAGRIKGGPQCRP